MIKNIVTKLSLVVVATCLVFVQTYPVKAAGAALSLSPASGTFNKGCTYSIDVRVDTAGASTAGADVVLFYDPTRLSVQQPVKNGTIYSEYPGSSVDTQLGKVSILGINSSPSSVFKGKGTFATIDFKVLDTAPSGLTQVRFDFDPQSLGQANDSNIVDKQTITDVLASVTGGSYTIGTGACSMAQGSAEGTVTPTKQPVIDDLTGDGNPSGLIIPTLLMVGVGVMLTIVGLIGLSLL